VKDLHNLRSKLRTAKRGGRTESEILATWIDEFVKAKPGNVAEKLVGNDGVLQCIFVQSGEMRKAFQSFPELQIIDGTFKVNAQNYLLFVQMAQDGGKHGLPVSYCFMRSEIEPHLRFYYECMSKHNDVSKTEIVFVDKDLHPPHPAVLH
jgi:hypothetical protein